MRGLTPVQVGIQPEFLRPNVDPKEYYRQAVHAMAALANGVLTTAGAYSPRRLMRSLLCAVKCIYREAKQAMTENNVKKSDLDAESFLPIMMYVVIHANLVSPCRTAHFLEEFGIRPTGASGEEAYYVCTFQMAVACVCNTLDKDEFVEET